MTTFPDPLTDIFNVVNNLTSEELKHEVSSRIELDMQIALTIPDLAFALSRRDLHTQIDWKSDPYMIVRISYRRSGGKTVGDSTTQTYIFSEEVVKNRSEKFERILLKMTLTSLLQQEDSAITDRPSKLATGMNRWT